MLERVLITGASSGTGAALAMRLASEGAHIALLARRRERLDELAAKIARETRGQAFVFPHDLRKVDEAPETFAKVVAALGGLDLFIGNAGVQYNLPVETIDPAKDREVLETNAVAAILWTNLAASHFLSQERGTIVGISSVAGERGRMLMGAYSASKAAYTTFLDSLRYRITPKGILVVTVKPGFMETEMTAGRNDLFWLISADEAAQRILANVRRGKEVFYLPRRWGLVSWLMKKIPVFLFRRIPA